MSTPTYSLRSTLRNYHDRNLALMEADEFRSLQQKVQRFSPDASAPLAARLLCKRVQNEVERRAAQPATRFCAPVSVQSTLLYRVSA